MNIYTIVTAMVVLGIVWGGMVLFLVKAYKSEVKKTDHGIR